MNSIILQSRMDTVLIKSENSETSDYHIIAQYFLT